jgi:4a-hydroxytetrahydrobiopterin dehydratase
MNKLSEEEIQNELANLKNWDVVDGKLYVEYKFKDFHQAFEFMTELSKTINKFDHHPDWTNSYNRVFINLVTHSAGGITELDIKLAKAAKQLADHYSA